ncbi:hypothetical protein TcCL_ESM07148, partial [Trypanosoma cruzi]
WDVNLHCSDRHRIRMCSHLLRSPVPPLTYFCAEDCAAGSSSAMFGRRNMARTNDLWEGDVHCDEKEKNVARRPPPQDRSEVVFCPLARGRLATWSVGRIIFLRLCALFLFRCVLLRTCEGRFARNSCEASVPSSEKRIPPCKTLPFKFVLGGEFLSIQRDFVLRI